jgi:hypothetical protein
MSDGLLVSGGSENLGSYLIHLTLIFWETINSRTLFDRSRNEGLDNPRNTTVKKETWRYFDAFLLLTHRNVLLSLNINTTVLHWVRLTL